MKFPFLTREEIIEVDNLAINKYGVQIEKLMENAGRGIARFITRLYPVPKKIFVFYGKGNNGGDGLVAARHLKIYGFDVRLIGAVSEGELNNTSIKELEVLKKIGIKSSEFDLNEVDIGDIIIDGLLGYNLNRFPSGKYAELIEYANASRGKGAKIISIDIPSGVDANNGKRFDPSIDADFVLALAMPKAGLRNIENVYVVNIGIPNRVYEEIGIPVKNYFKEKDIVKIE
jgi:NAD(P)H-hydrate epimerase